MEAQALHPNELADRLRQFIPAEDQALLDALLSKAVHNEHICDVCYTAARAEGAAEQLTVLGLCPHGKNLDMEFCSRVP